MYSKVIVIAMLLKLREMAAIYIYTTPAGSGLTDSNQTHLHGVIYSTRLREAIETGVNAALETSTMGLSSIVTIDTPDGQGVTKLPA